MRDHVGDWIERIDEDTNYLNSGAPDPFKKLKEPFTPPKPLIFKAFESCPFGRVRVVILGQDPYHTPGKATGLAFGVPKNWTKLNSSLLNIKKEVEADVGGELSNLTLEQWAEQGVLLMNTRLTVEPDKPMSHEGLGWEEFTEAVMETLNSYPEPLVFILWGAEARKWGEIITDKRHLKLIASHPCKYSAHLSFIGCKHFSKANTFLAKINRGQIKWTN